jgi:Domain of unknown function (DUF4430)
MDKKRYLKSLIWIGFVVLVPAIAFLYLLPVETPLPTTGKTLHIENVRMKIEALSYDEELTVKDGETALRLVERLSDGNPPVAVVTKEYVGLGTLIEQIGAYKNGTDNKYWQYYVNGKLAMIGAGSYVIQAGDVIEWKFATPETF